LPARRAPNPGGPPPPPTHTHTHPPPPNTPGVNTRPSSNYLDPKMWQEGLESESFAFPAPVTWSIKGVRYQMLTFDDILSCYYSFYNLLLRSQVGSVFEVLISVTNRDEAPILHSSQLNALFIIIFQILLGIFVAQVMSFSFTRMSFSFTRMSFSFTRMSFSFTRMSFHFPTYQGR